MICQRSVFNMFWSGLNSLFAQQLSAGIRLNYYDFKTGLNGGLGVAPMLWTTILWRNTFSLHAYIQSTSNYFQRSPKKNVTKSFRNSDVTRHTKKIFSLQRCCSGLSPTEVAGCCREAEEKAKKTHDRWGDDTCRYTYYQWLLLAYWCRSEMYVVDV